MALATYLAQSTDRVRRMCLRARIWKCAILQTPSTCLSKLSWPSKVTPRILMVSDGSIPQPATRTDWIWCVVLTLTRVPQNKTSDFVGFRARPLFDNHSSRAQLHLSRITSDVCGDFGMTLTYRWVSSANWWNDRPWEEMRSAIRATNREKRIGPKTLPSGTPNSHYGGRRHDIVIFNPLWSILKIGRNPGQSGSVEDVGISKSGHQCLMFQRTVYRPRVSAHDLLGLVIWTNACEFSIVIMIAHLQINKFKRVECCR